MEAPVMDATVTGPRKIVYEKGLALAVFDDVIDAICTKLLTLGFTGPKRTTLNDMLPVSKRQVVTGVMVTTIAPLANKRSMKQLTGTVFIVITRPSTLSRVRHRATPHLKENKALEREQGGKYGRKVRQSVPKVFAAKMRQPTVMLWSAVIQSNANAPTCLPRLPPSRPPTNVRAKSAKDFHFWRAKSIALANLLHMKKKSVMYEEDGRGRELSQRHNDIRA